MKSCHDIASVISEEALKSIKECYSIPEGYVLRAPSPEQRPYQPQPSEISISVDALEAGLRFPLHSTIVKCLRWWRISPSQMAPNSWRYLIAFLGECQGAGLVPSRTLFFACFRLCKSRGDYYLTARASFKVSGASTNNKGWKAWDLCGMRIQEDDEGYYVLQMADWAPKDSSQRCGLGGRTCPTSPKSGMTPMRPRSLIGGDYTDAG
ncbi:hypothetical protein BHE74_00016996 [Ensete ventricosum]|nr:hypothetical protein BHE74_00016996 [Ensete ventricosum]